MLCGGFTKFRPVTEEDVKVFNDAKGMLLGVTYEPLIVATQLVAGTNYKFICNAEAAVLHPNPYLAEISVFQPLPSEEEKNPMPILTGINALH